MNNKIDKINRVIYFHLHLYIQARVIIAPLRSEIFHIREKSFWNHPAAKIETSNEAVIEVNDKCACFATININLSQFGCNVHRMRQIIPRDRIVPRRNIPACRDSIHPRNTRNFPGGGGEASPLLNENASLNLSRLSISRCNALRGKMARRSIFAHASDRIF